MTAIGGVHSRTTRALVGGDRVAHSGAPSRATGSTAAATVCVRVQTEVTSVPGSAVWEVRGFSMFDDIAGTLSASPALCPRSPFHSRLHSPRALRRSASGRVTILAMHRHLRVLVRVRDGGHLVRSALAPKLRSLDSLCV
jgi:hypothetical protein